MRLKDWRVIRPALVPAIFLITGLLIGLLFVRGSDTAVGQPVPATDPPEAASVFDDVDECDLLAAHPGDPLRVAEGVADGSIIPRLAVRACETAVRQHPNELRFAYQLGRAYAAADRSREGQGQFERATAGNYAAAFAAKAELGVDNFSGETKNSILSYVKTAQSVLAGFADLHAQAVQGGFSASQSRIEALTFDPAIYTQAILGQISKGEFPAASASSQQPDIRAYLYTFATNLMGQCGPVLDAQAVVNLAIYRFNGKITAEQEDSPAVAIQPLVGEIDAQRFVRRHGCDGPIPQYLLFRPLALFLANP